MDLKKRNAEEMNVLKAENAQMKRRLEETEIERSQLEHTKMHPTTSPPRAPTKTMEECS